jgi:hypothetical protein
MKLEDMKARAEEIETLKERIRIYKGIEFAALPIHFGDYILG